MSARAAPPPAVGSGAMFDQIARRYDLLNRVISLGLDGRWRRRLVAAVAPAEPRRLLDVATGTADVALALAARYPQAEVWGLDPSRNMLAAGRRKTGAVPRVTLLEGDAQRLPFADDRFDACTISFGIRNVPDRTAALREMARVTRPGGAVAVLELSEPRGLLGPLGRLHVHGVIPAVGALLGAGREYAYLARSIAAFPAPATFAAQLAAAGAGDVAITPLLLGAVHLYVGRVAGPGASE